MWRVARRRRRPVLIGGRGPECRIDTRAVPPPIAPLTCRSVYKQQEAETECGEQARKTRAVVEGLGNHRFRSHREQCSGSKCLQPRWPRLTERTEPNIPYRDCYRSPDGDRTPEQKDVNVTAAGSPHPRCAR